MQASSISSRLGACPLTSGRPCRSIQHQGATRALTDLYDLLSRRDPHGPRHGQRQRILVMTYATPAPHGRRVGHSSPQSFMMYDIAALQALRRQFRKVGRTIPGTTRASSSSTASRSPTGVTETEKIFSTVWTKAPRHLRPQQTPRRTRSTPAPRPLPDVLNDQLADLNVDAGTEGTSRRATSTTRAYHGDLLRQPDDRHRQRTASMPTATCKAPSPSLRRGPARPLRSTAAPQP